MFVGKNDDIYGKGEPGSAGNGRNEEHSGNSHFDLDVVGPFDKDWIPPVETRWQYFGWHTYATLRKGSSIEDFEHKLNVALTKITKDNPFYKGVFTPLQKVTDIHFYSHLES